MLKVRPDQVDAVWECPGCNQQNVIYLISDEIKDARREAGAIQNVKCEECGRRYNTL
jgi:transcription elongation factor Elf1